MSRMLVSTDPERLEVTLERSLPVAADRVWQSWTSAEHLESWWGPEGWSTTVYALDVRPGGLWHFGMGPIDEPREVWVRSVYSEIIEGTALSYLEGFSDASGADLDPEPNAVTVELFELEPGTTRLVLRTRFASAARLQQITDMGMVEGWEGGFDRLEQVVTEKGTR